MIHIEFEDRVVEKKISPEFQLFINIMQHVTFKYISTDTKYCISQPLGNYDVFGIKSGDTIQFLNDNVTVLISFH